jgi:hypothetical protein
VQALAMLAQGGHSAAKRAELVEIVRRGLAGPPARQLPPPSTPLPPPTQLPQPAQLPPSTPLPPPPVPQVPPPPPADLEREYQARKRQVEIDAVRALAELASEVEERTVNETKPQVLVHEVRAWVRRSGLEPIERAGEEIGFDRKKHKPIGGSIRDGALVVVVRPGYVWKTPTEDVLISKAIVEE